MKNILKLIAIAALLFVPRAARSEDAGKPPLKIGVIASLTGDAARDGLNWLEGAKLAADELNESGKKIELVVEDDHTNPAKVAAAFTKLVSVDKVSGIVGGTWDFLAEAAYPLAKQQRVPFITATNPIEILSDTAKASPWVFTNGLSLAAEREAIEKFLRSKNVKTIALLYINVPYGTMHGTLLRDIAKELGVKVVVDTEYDYGGFAQDFRITALKIAQQKPDVAFIVTGYEGADLFLRELERVHAAPMVLMTHCLKAAYDFGGSPARYKNAFGIFSKLSSKSFAAAFEKKYGREPYDYAPLGYDAVKFMAQVVEALSGHEIEKLEITYEGATGAHKLPSPTRSVVRSEAAIMQMRDGKLEELLLPSPSDNREVSPGGK